MNTFKFVFAVWLTTGAAVAAAHRDVGDLVGPILKQSEKPFISLVNATTATSLPPLPAPGETADDQPLSQVTALLWKRLTSVDLRVTPTNKVDRLESLTAMCALREWLLKHDAYTNLVMASYIEEAVTTAILAALADGSVNITEAKKVTAALNQQTTVGGILKVVNELVPKSQALREFRDENAQSKSIIELSERLSRELDELIDMRAEKLMEGRRPASIIFYVGHTSATNYISKLLIEYVEGGGNLNLNSDELRDDLNKRKPNLLEKIEPVTGMKVELAMCVAIMENVNDWRAKHANTSRRSSPQLDR